MNQVVIKFISQPKPKLIRKYEAEWNDRSIDQPNPVQSNQTRATHTSTQTLKSSPSVDLASEIFHLLYSHHRKTWKRHTIALTSNSCNNLSLSCTLYTRYIHNWNTYSYIIHIYVYVRSIDGTVKVFKEFVQFYYNPYCI